MASDETQPCSFESSVQYPKIVSENGVKRSEIVFSWEDDVAWFLDEYSAGIIALEVLAEKVRRSGYEKRAKARLNAGKRLAHPKLSSNPS
jgi:hypothetical protein